MDKNLIYIKKILHEFNLTTDNDFLKSRQNRIMLHKKDPSSFLSIGHRNTPIFPVKTHDGSTSISVLKRSLMAAKGLKTKRMDVKYDEIISKLEQLISMFNNKVINYPAQHKVNKQVNIILGRTRNIDIYGNNGNNGGEDSD